MSVLLTLRPGTTGLNIRRGPGTQYPVLSTLRPGERGSVAGRSTDGEWVWLAGPDGWAAAAFLSVDVGTMVVEQNVIPAGASNRPGTLLRPTFVTVHNTANPSPGADARMHGRYLKGADARARQVSWHYTVDDQRVVQHLPDTEVGWHAGKNGNAVSLGVEVCEHAGIDEPAAVERAARLVALLCRRHGITAPRVVTHQHWTGKDCPRVLLRRPGGFAAFRALVASYL
jgi:hypothetical protein